MARATRAFAAVQINEIAWMGTSVSANAEWIELYNPDSASVDLTGWKLTATDGSPNISLSGTIPASSYFILERTSDNTLPGITANQIYTGALSNSGEHLQLTDATGAVIDNVDASAGWPAGDDATKNTMQKSGSSWITAAPTPNAANASNGVNPPSAAGNGSGNPTTTVTTNPSDDSDSPNQVGNISKTMEETPVKPDPKFSASAVIPDYGTAGVAVPMSISVRDNGHKDYVTGKFVWSYGDGASDTFVQNTPVMHIYYYQGNYPVTLTYYSNELKSDPDYLFKKTIQIIPAGIAIAGTTDDGGVILQNNSTDDIDLENWKLNSQGFQYAFPKYTTVPSGGDLYVSSHVVGFRIQKNSSVSIANPTGVLISNYNSFPSPKNNSYAHGQEDSWVLAASKSDQDASGVMIPQVPAPVSKVPEEDGYGFWQDHKKIITAIGIILVIVLAYGGVRLYAGRNSSELFDEDDLDLKDADDFL